MSSARDAIAGAALGCLAARGLLVLSSTAAWPTFLLCCLGGAGVVGLLLVGAVTADRLVLAALLVALGWGASVAAQRLVKIAFRWQARRAEPRRARRACSEDEVFTSSARLVMLLRARCLERAVQHIRSVPRGALNLGRPYGGVDALVAWATIPIPAISCDEEATDAIRAVESGRVAVRAGESARVGDALEAFHALLDAGAGAWLNRTSTDESTPLIHAIAARCHFQKRILMTHPDVGASVGRDARGDNALMCAIRGGDSDVSVLSLLGRTADINVQNGVGESALALAVQGPCGLFAHNILVRADLDLDRVDGNGKTILRAASELAVGDPRPSDVWDHRESIIVAIQARVDRLHERVEVILRTLRECCTFPHGIVDLLRALLAPRDDPSPFSCSANFPTRDRLPLAP
jgi:hypothetical protein